MVAPENIHTATEKVVFKNVCVYTCMHVTTVNEKGGHEFKRARRGTWEVLEGGKGREKMI